MSDSPHTITEKTSIKLPIGVWVALTAAIVGATANFVISQNQIAAHEQRLERLEGERKLDRELLLRIDERTGEIKRQIERISY